MNTLENSGRRMVFWGALLLCGWAGYEMAVRLDEMSIWLTPVFKWALEGKLSLVSDYFREVPWHRLQTHFLLACVLFSLFALAVRKRFLPLVLTCVGAVLLAVFSLGGTPLMSSGIWQQLKMVPLALIAIGSALCFSLGLKRKAWKKRPPVQPQPKPYDPFRMNRP